MRLLLTAGCCAALCAMVLPVSTSAAGEDEPPLEEILVSGEYPGPGLWKVSKPAGESEHVLWIFGTLFDTPSGEPTALKWKSRQVEKIVAESQELVYEYQFGLTFEQKVGVFTILRMLPTALKARKNPDDKTLADLLPVDVYPRWQMLKAEYLGGSDGIEKWRPFIVAERLRDKAGEKLRPKFSGNQWTAVNQLVQQNRLRLTMPTYEVKLPNEKLRESMKAFVAKPLNDVECLDVTMKLVEFWGDDAAVNARALAWARGDLPALRALPPLPDPDGSCMAALLGSQAVQDLHLQGLDDPAASGARAWLEAVDKALADNPSTLAILPVDELLKENGRLSMLREKGYRVEEPI